MAADSMVTNVADYDHTSDNFGAPETKINYSLAAPHALMDYTILLCWDTEFTDHDWKNYPPQTLTEIGFSWIDTRDLKGIAPGKLAENWRQYVHACHILIAEMSAFRTKSTGCDPFPWKGKRDIVKRDLIASHVTEFLRQHGTVAVSEVDKADNKAVIEDPIEVDSLPEASANYGPEPDQEIPILESQSIIDVEQPQLHEQPTVAQATGTVVPVAEAVEVDLDNASPA